MILLAIFAFLSGLGVLGGKLVVNSFPQSIPMGWKFYANALGVRIIFTTELTELTEDTEKSPLIRRSQVLPPCSPW